MALINSPMNNDTGGRCQTRDRYVEGDAEPSELEEGLSSFRLNRQPEMSARVFSA